jgi:insulysin
MQQFFATYISPTSQQRAKLAIHMHAQGVSNDTAIPLDQPNAVEKQLEAAGVPEPVAEGVAKGILHQQEIEISAEKQLKQDHDGDQVVDDINESGSTNKPYIIKNVREFKSLMAVSAGPQPVRDLSEFEELDSKL